MEPLECKICGLIMKGDKGYGMPSHIIRTHKKPYAEYLAEYILPFAPRCANPNCEKRCRFQSIGVGFTKYCCIHCAREGEQNHRWIGGKIGSKGYIKVRCEGHPRASKLGHYVLEHDLIMEQYIGRYLVKGEVVHHINRIRSDNRLENLELTLKGKHIGGHNQERIWKPESLQKKKDYAAIAKRNDLGRFVKVGVTQ